ncbi:unnamed protein product [Trypanosoma congolense IL3000]|uniref:WGS project CAEQ00000000 data, annotated contig 2162 n=1 Tax=Trypanosoma congolense (strain IL3000) TaxID=1068625 RepID=F9WBY5_TRYCI|nr:unnamed protein product [Trypanosoma congolense IL3000]
MNEVSIPQVRDVANDLSATVIFVAMGGKDFMNEGMIGYIILNVNFLAASVVAITWISVLSRFRGNHVGRSLLQHVESFCRANKVKYLEVMKTYDSTQLFRKQGFRSVSKPIAFISAAQRKTVVFSQYPPVPHCIADGSVILRYATPEDRKRWTCCILEACSYLSGCSELVVNAFSAEFRITAVSKETNRVVAIASMDSTGWIPLIACLQEYQGKGLGSFMMFIAMEWLRRQGGDTVTLTPLNNNVIKFYERWSFTVSSKSAGKRRRSSDDMPILVRKLMKSELYLPEGNTVEDFVQRPLPEAGTVLMDAGSG